MPDVNAYLDCPCRTTYSINLSNILDEFTILRERCSALKEILLPDDIWGRVQSLILKRLKQPDMDGAFHFPCSFLAFQNRSLGNMTSPIHRYLLEAWKSPSKAGKKNAY